MTPTVKDIANLPADKLPPLVHVPPVTKPFDVTIRPPGSKSLTNRALLLAALAEGESVLTGALADADDAQVMVRALRQLGAEIEVTPEVEPNGESCGNATIRVKGVGGRWKIKPGETVTLNLNNAGTATRFLTAAAVLQPPDSGGIIIDGNARMRERPIGELVDALRRMEQSINYVGNPGYPPIHVHPMAAAYVGPLDASLGAAASSQFASALLLLGPFIRDGVRIQRSKGEPSAGYISMTGLLVFNLGAGGFFQDNAGHLKPRVAFMERPSIRGFGYNVEADASGAAPFAAACALLTGSVVRFYSKGLAGTCLPHRDADPPPPIASLQPDVEFLLTSNSRGAVLDLSQSQTVITGGEFILPVNQDYSLIPDTAMTGTVVAAFASGASRIAGVQTLRVKETDRVGALQAELAKVGVTVSPQAYTTTEGVHGELIDVVPPPGGIDCSPSAPRVEFDTYDDHRMAMSLALIGLRRPNVYIRDPGCVRKTYPTFWRDLAKLYG